MSEPTPILNRLNIIAGDFNATLVFYGQRGLPVPEEASHDGILTLPSGLILNSTTARSRGSTTPPGEDRKAAVSR